MVPDDVSLLHGGRYVASRDEKRKLSSSERGKGGDSSSVGNTVTMKRDTQFLLQCSHHQASHMQVNAAPLVSLCLFDLCMPEQPARCREGPPDLSKLPLLSAVHRRFNV